ncbi:MAG: hypothetical protein SF123_08165 [Chloroflexota bacterium]|nr:hypothetical protein [Chloroflexota bacterium]
MTFSQTLYGNKLYFILHSNGEYHFLNCGHYVKFKHAFLLCLLVLLSNLGHDVKAQSECTAVVRDAIAIIGQTCIATGRNQVCHGYFRVEVKPTIGQPMIPFAVGDVADLDAISTLHTYPMNMASGEWGVALMQVQANLPDVLPGQNVTFLLMGDTSVTESFDAPRFTPMQAIRLETGVAGVSCEGVPTNGLLIQTPRGAQEVKLLVNGVEITMAGTAFVEAVPGEDMTVTSIAGNVSVSVGEDTQMIAPQAQVTIPMSPDLVPVGSPSFPVATGTDYTMLIPSGDIGTTAVQSPVEDSVPEVISTPTNDQAGPAVVTNTASTSGSETVESDSSSSPAADGVLVVLWQIISGNGPVVVIVIVIVALILIVIYALVRRLVERLQDSV